jgi:molybdopterin converting factor small subunit
LVTVWIPALLRDITDGIERVEVTGRSVGEVIRNLDKRFPGIKDRLCINDKLDPSISVAVDGIVSHSKLNHKLQEDNEIHFLPVFAGGGH